MFLALINVRHDMGAVCLCQDKDLLWCSLVFMLFFFSVLGLLTSFHIHTNRYTKGNFQASHHRSNNSILLSVVLWEKRKAWCITNAKKTKIFFNLYCVGNTRYRPPTKKKKLYAYTLLLVCGFFTRQNKLLINWWEGNKLSGCVAGACEERCRGGPHEAGIKLIK